MSTEPTRQERDAWYAKHAEDVGETYFGVVERGLGWEGKPVRTANVRVEGAEFEPGIWLCDTQWGGGVGTVGKHERDLVEVHIIGFHGFIYGEEVRLRMLRRYELTELVALIYQIYT